MITQSRYPLHAGEWVYLTEPMGKYPTGTYGKFEFYAALLQAQIKTPLGEVLLVHPDKMSKLSTEEISYKDDDEYMLIEPLGDFPAGTCVHFIKGLGGDIPTCFTNDGLEVFAVPKDHIMRMVTEQENAVVWFIQQCLRK